MENFEKVIRIGVFEGNNIYCTIKYTNGRLSISGVVGPLKNGNCKGGCGQINSNLINHISEIIPAPNWDRMLILEFLNIWSEWHLNDLIPGSPLQETFLKEYIEDWKISKGVFNDYYSWACFILKDAGLYPDKSYLYNGKPYFYGQVWLQKEVPDDVLEFLKELPNSNKVYPKKR